MPQISGGKFDRLRRATTGFTTSELDGYGLLRSCARSPATVGLVSGSCSSARAFAPRFFQAPPRGECYFSWDRARARRLSGGGLPVSPFRYARWVHSSTVVTFPEAPL